MMPGDPINMMVDRKVPEAKRAQMAEELGLNDPFLVQYGRWIKGIVFEQDFGNSVRYKTPVWDLMKDRVPRSVTLCGWALIIEMIIALPLGLLCAIKKDSIFDRIAVSGSLLLTAMPSFWLGALLVIVFAVTLKILPISGYQGAKYFILPIFALVSSTIAGTLRLTRAEVLEVLNEKYVTRRGSQGASRAAPGKSCLHAGGEGERVLALESREGTRASRRVEGLSRSLSGVGGKPSFPSPSAGTLGNFPG